MRAIILLTTVLALSACGSRKELTPAEGMTPVPVARGAEEPATPAELVTPDSQARPDRSAEPLKRSEERQPDPFDLPPS